MHMADALISPAVGGTMWAASAGLIGYCSKKIKNTLDDKHVPLMGVLGAFVFAAQMINFSIPGTGSSGHLGGGMILAILLGPHAAFLVLASVLVVQALFFADGGLLALGCNIFNLGFFPCFIAYPLIFRKLAGQHPTQSRVWLGSTIAAIIALQLGAFSVVLETVFSGMSNLPFRAFALMMQPIHLAIGLIEGLVTATVVSFVWKARPEILATTWRPNSNKHYSIKNVLLALLLVTVLTSGFLSWFASTHPDGLEWAISKTSGTAELETPEHGIHRSLENIQKKTSFLPDYGFESAGSEETGTTVSGLTGSILTLLIVVTAGFLMKNRKHLIQ